jgi:hypothetical protein
MCRLVCSVVEIYQCLEETCCGHLLISWRFKSNMEAANSSEIAVTIYHSTPRHIPEGWNHQHRCENFKSRIPLSCWRRRQILPDVDNFYQLYGVTSHQTVFKWTSRCCFWQWSGCTETVAFVSVRRWAVCSGMTRVTNRGFPLLSPVSVFQLLFVWSGYLECLSVASTVLGIFDTGKTL